jgi:hypothetical protein
MWIGYESIFLIYDRDDSQLFMYGTLNPRAALSRNKGREENKKYILFLMDCASGGVKFLSDSDQKVNRPISMLAKRLIVLVTIITFLGEKGLLFHTHTKRKLSAVSSVWIVT